MNRFLHIGAMCLTTPMHLTTERLSVDFERLSASAEHDRYAYLKPPILRRSVGRLRLDDRISITDSQNSFQNQFLKALVRQRVLEVSNLA